MIHQPGIATNQFIGVSHALDYFSWARITYDRSQLPCID